MFGENSIKVELQGINTVYRYKGKFYKDSVSEANLIDFNTTKVESMSSSDDKMDVYFKDSALPTISELSNKDINEIIKTTKDKIVEIQPLNQIALESIKPIIEDIKDSDLDIVLLLKKIDPSIASLDLSEFKNKVFISTQEKFHSSQHLLNANVNDIKTGDGDDKIYATGLVGQSLNISTGKGDDEIYFTGSIKEGSESINITNETVIDGGEGDEDNITVNDNVDFRGLKLKNIEGFIFEKLTKNLDVNNIEALYEGGSGLQYIELNKNIENALTISNIKADQTIHLLPNVGKANTEELTLNRDATGELKLGIYFDSGKVQYEDMKKYIKLGENVTSLKMEFESSKDNQIIKIDGSELLSLKLSPDEEDKHSTYSKNTVKFDLGANSTKLQTIDASEFEGGFNFTAKAEHSALETIKGSKGKDVIDVSVINKTVAIDLSAGGDDEIIVKSGVDISNLQFITIKDIGAGDKISFNNVNAENRAITKNEVEFDTDIKTTINGFLANNDASNTIYMLNVTGSSNEVDNGVYIIHNVVDSSGALTNDDSVVKLSGIVNSASEDDSGVITIA